MHYPLDVLPNFLFLISGLFMCAAPVAAQRKQQPKATSVIGSKTGTAGPMVIGEPSVFSISGWVAEADSHSGVTDARIELHALTGELVGQTSTRGSGNFEFDNIPEGTYTLIVEPIGYETVSRQVEVPYGPTSGIEIEVGEPIEGGTRFREGGKTSVRELSIPQKAQDAMQKGMDLLYKKLDYPGSIKQFRRAVDAYPTYYEAYAYMGIAYEKLGDVSSSERALRRSVELSQDHYLNALCLLAALLSDNGRSIDAEPIAREAVGLDKQSWQANSALGNALLGLHRNDEAEISLATAVKLQPQNPTLHLMLANAHIRMRNYAALLDDLNTYLRLDPKGPFADQARVQREAVRSALARVKAESGSITTQ